MIVGDPQECDPCWRQKRWRLAEVKCPTTDGCWGNEGNPEDEVEYNCGEVVLAHIRDILSRKLILVPISALSLLGGQKSLETISGIEIVIADQTNQPIFVKVIHSFKYSLNRRTWWVVRNVSKLPRIKN